MSKKTVEITLESLECRENGEFGKEEGNNVLTSDLVYPSPGNTGFGTVKKMKLKDNDSIDFQDPKYTYADRILFKEEIVGESELSVQLTEVQGKKGIDKFLGDLLKGLYSTVFGLLTGSIANVVVGIPLNLIKGKVDSIENDPDDKVRVIGAGSLSIKVDELPEPGGVVSKPIDLEVPNDVIHNDPQYNNTTKRWDKNKHVILEKGKSNGTLNVKIRVL